MKTLNLQQGTPEWLAARAKMFTASEAPAMMGTSPYMSRNELLRQKYTGRQKDVDAATQRIFDKGHEIEALARPIAEKIIGDELYPVTVCDDDGRLSASLDGAVMDGSIIWECKQWNAEKAKDVELGIVPARDYWQIVQQMHIFNADRCLYMVTDGTEENTRHCWVENDEPLKSDTTLLLAGWAQFEKDLASYQPPEIEQDVVGTNPETLPYLTIQVEGRVIATNLDQFKSHAVAVFDSISTDLETDQDFADAELAVKWCKDVEDRLQSAKEAALAQTADIDALFKAIDDISDSARRKRLSLDKLVKGRKEARKTEIQQQAVDALSEHYEQINSTLTHGIQVDVPASFRSTVGAAMKGKRTIQSLVDAADQALTDAKLLANAEADLIRTNLASYSKLADGHEHLFADLMMLVCKPAEDFNAAIKLRIAEYQSRKQPEPPREQPKPTKSATIKLGDINARLSPITINAEGLSALGFEPCGQKGAAKLYAADDFPLICEALEQLLRALRTKREAA